MNKSKLVVLGLLNESPMHGYQIVSEIKHRSMDHWARINTATIYNTLSSLEEKSFVVSKKKKEGNFPERKEYRVTFSGRKETVKLVKKSLRTIVPDNLVEFLLAVGFIGIIEPDEARKILRERGAEMQENISRVKEIKTTHAGLIPANWMYIIDHSINTYELHIKELLILSKDLSGKEEPVSGGHPK